MTKNISCKYCDKSIRLEWAGRKYCDAECYRRYKKENSERLQVKRNQLTFRNIIEKNEKHLKVEDLGQWLHIKYVDEKKSYREIMELLDRTGNRTIKRLLEFYNIPIRRGSEAIASQWHENEARRRKQTEWMRSVATGNAVRRRTDKEIANEYKLDGKEFIKREIVDGYSYVTYKCMKCRRIHVQSLGNKNRGCPDCSLIVSKGERAVANVLRERGIEYQAEYVDVKCRNKHPLPFDFALFSHDEVVALLEYQGVQHYEPVEFFGGKKQLEVQQKHDRIKREFCKSRNIPLIEIPYTVNDIEQYLESQLKKISSMQLTLI